MDIQELFRLGMDRPILPLQSMGEGLVINVGAGNKQIPGTKGVDYPDWDADSMPLPFSDGSVFGIHAYHFLEHVKNPVAVLMEFQRVLKSGGLVNVVVPYYTSQMSAQDLDHKTRWCEETWRVLFRNPYYNKNGFIWEFEIGTNLIIGTVERIYA
jgi:SAM-dependent methyltransferase